MVKSNQSIKVRSSIYRFFLKSVDFFLPVRDCVIICIVVDLALADKICLKNVIYIKKSKYQRPKVGALWDSINFFAHELTALQSLTCWVLLER